MQTSLAEFGYRMTITEKKNKAKSSYTAHKITCAHNAHTLHPMFKFTLQNFHVDQ